jgi:hypothetical protein
MAAAQVRKTCADSVKAVTITERIKLPQFYRTASWAVFSRQFETAAHCNKRVSCKKAEHLLVVLGWRPSEIRRQEADDDLPV